MAPITRRVLTLTPEGATITGGSRITTVASKEGWKPSRVAYTRTAETILARMAAGMVKAGFQPYQLEVEILCPERMLFGFNKSRVKVTWPSDPQVAASALDAVVADPQPKSRSKKASASTGDNQPPF